MGGAKRSMLQWKWVNHETSCCISSSGVLELPRQYTSSWKAPKISSSNSLWSEALFCKAPFIMFLLCICLRYNHISWILMSLSALSWLLCLLCFPFTFHSHLNQICAKLCSNSGVFPPLDDCLSHRVWHHLTFPCPEWCYQQCIWSTNYIHEPVSKTCFFTFHLVSLLKFHRWLNLSVLFDSIGKIKSSIS